MKRSLIVVALASAMFGGLLAQAKPAAAWWTRSYGGSLFTLQEGIRVFPAGAVYPVLSTSEMSAANATEIYVETWNHRSDSLGRVQICAARWNGGGVVCSPQQEQTGQGHKRYDFSADEAVWNSASFFPYVTVQAQTTTGVAADVLRVTGIFVGG